VTANRLMFARLLGVSAVSGVVVALGFVGFEAAAHELRHLVWEFASTPGRTVALATLGGLALGVAIQLVPGRGGPHPAEHQGLVPETDQPPGVWLGVLVVGFIALVGGASLGPEGAIIPAAAGVSGLAARWARLPENMRPLAEGAGLSALIATMFGSPLAGAVPLLEVIPAGAVSNITWLVLPALTASAMAAITISVLGVEPAGFLQLGFDGFRAEDMVWAVLIGAVAGAVGLAVDRLTPVLRAFTTRLDRHGILLTTTLGGAVLGVLYVVGGPEVRFAGIPELQFLVAGTDSAVIAALATVVKVVATSWCLAVGYRGGKIFPIAFAGGGAGLTIHLLFDAVPLDVAVGVGLAAAIATGLGAPVTAGLIAAVVVGPSLLPLALIGVVVAHGLHLLAPSPAEEVEPHA
jgi:H+/Cl- antiporter ClcA